MKKKLLLACLYSFAVFGVKAQTKIKDGSISATSSLPAAGSALELESNKRGLRMPQVSLTTTTTWLSAGSGAASTSPGMTVYNTNAAITSSNTTYPANGIGEYYWDGNGWVNKNSATAQNSLVLFSVKRTTFQAVTQSTWNTINFGSADYDKNGNFNLTTDAFTVPANAAGFYQINGNFATTIQAANQGGYLGLFVNGTFKRYITIGNANSGAGIVSAGTIVVPLAAGDVVDIEYNPNTSGQTVSAQVDVYQISK